MYVTLTTPMVCVLRVLDPTGIPVGEEAKVLRPREGATIGVQRPRLRLREPRGHHDRPSASNQRCTAHDVFPSRSESGYFRPVYVKSGTFPRPYRVNRPKRPFCAAGPARKPFESGYPVHVVYTVSAPVRVWGASWAALLPGRSTGEPGGYGGLLPPVNVFVPRLVCPAIARAGGFPRETPLRGLTRVDQRPPGARCLGSAPGVSLESNRVSTCSKTTTPE